MKFAPNDIKNFVQDYIIRYNGTAEGNLMSKTFSMLREVTLGYTLPSDLLQKTFIKQASISLVGRNLFYFIDKKHDGVDMNQHRGLQETI